MSEEITERYYVRRREFLNEDPSWPGFIIGIVEDTRGIPDDDPERGWTNGTIMLDLADCKRRVSFCFVMCNKSERANSLRKITLIAEVVNAVRDAIALEVESHNSRSGRFELARAEAVLPAKTSPANTEMPRTQSFASHFTTLGL
ncbi:MAG: hypothetical protein H7Z16_15415 [Pyrinomonadaceae bacterium]|nr:hypothetical protein [Pyrinomonadaceae bacterium]